MAVVDYASTTKAIGELQNLNQWTIQFTLGGGLSMSDDVRFRCVSASLPEEEWSTKEATINRFKITQPGTLSRNGSITLTFLESTDAATTELMSNISKLYWSQDSNTIDGLASADWDSLKSTVVMNLLDSQGNTTRTYTLKDCIFQPATGGDLGSDDEVMQVSVTVLFNWWSDE